MLNSHMKSHTNVYQYRCADCTYATKYCHSLKLHLRKYGHKPAMVLNNDGSPNNLPSEMFGGGGGGGSGGVKRPKSGSSARKGAEDMFPPSMLPQFPPLPPSIMQMQLQHLQNQFAAGGHHGPPPPPPLHHHPKLPQVPPFRLDDPKFGHHKLGEASNGNHSPSPGRFFGGAVTPEEQLRCDKCEFRTASKEVFRNHMMLHASSDRTSALHHLLTSPLAAAQAKQQRPPFPSDLNKSAEELSPSGGGLFPPGAPRIRSSSPSSPRSFSSSGGGAARSLLDKSESPPSSTTGPPFPPHMSSYLNKLAMHNPLLQGLMPNPALRALIEERQKESMSSLGGSLGGTTSDSSQRDTPDSFASREGGAAAPLPPNKRHKADIFSTLYANRMNEQQSEKSESPNAALDLSKDNVIIGGGSHGSSASDVDTGSNPRSHSSSPALSAGTSKSSSRRKGKAYKIARAPDSEEECGGSSAGSAIGSTEPPMPGLMPVGGGVGKDSNAVDSDQHSNGDRFEDTSSACKYCGILFRNSMMHRLHMQYHSFEDPFKCEMCGEQCDDALSFFLHIAKREHT